MTTPHPQHPHPEAVIYQDRLIAERLPAWVREASVAQMQQVHQALLASLQARERCTELLDRLQGIEAFTRPRLQQAMQVELGLQEAQALWRMGRKEPVMTSQPIGWPVSKAVYRTVTPLEAALRNFTHAEAQGDQLAGNRLEPQGSYTGALPSPARFATFCRRLDLGGQYQRHLDQVLSPPALEVIAEQQRCALQVEAHIAWIEGALDADEHRLLGALCARHDTLSLRGDPVRVRRLQLLGCQLEQIVVLDVRDESLSPVYTDSRRLIVHIPGDPVAPLRAYGTLRQFANDLGKRLRTPGYQRFFSRFVRRRDSQAFFAQVIAGYAGLSDLANSDLQEHLHDWGTPLFAALGAARIAQIKDDAALIATPVAGLDRAVQEAHDRRLAAEGWALLNLAGLFVPGLGLALAGVAAWQLLTTVYHGVDAWHEGDRSAALDHLCQVAVDVAVLAATAAGAALAHRAWSRAWQVDELVPVTLADGGVSLGRGVLRSEVSDQWTSPELFRRLSSTRYPLSDEDIAQLLMATHTSREDLQVMYLRGDATDALLRDSTRRATLDGRIRAMIGRLRSGLPVEDSTVRAHAERLPGGSELPDQALAELAWRMRRTLFESLDTASQDSETPAMALLRRDFPGLPQALASELTGQLTPAQTRRMLDNGRVPLALAQAARQALWRARVTRACEGLYLDTPQTLDHARLAVGLLAYLPGVASDLGVRLYDGLLASAPVMQSAPGAARQFELLHGAGRFQLFDTRGQAVSQQPGELFDTLAAAFTEGERNEVGVGEPFAHNLRVLIGGLAGADRARLEQVLGRATSVGWFRVPQRLNDGRTGYLLSGRGRGQARPRALYAMVRALYPLYEDLEVEHWARRAREAGQQVEEQLARLAGELSTLHGTLRDWASFATSRTERAERQHLGEALVRGWQRMAPRIIDGGLEVAGYRLSLLGVSLESLPELPESISFGHVRELSFRNMGLRQVSRGFLRAFPGLRVLELSGNRLASLPEGLEHLRELTELDLYDNQIVLDSAQVRALENCVTLQYLNLSFNPLGRTFSVRRLNRLRNLNLRAAQLPRVPPALLGRLELAIADLRDNRIRRLPERFFQTPLWISSTILLEENPLDEETMLRFELYMTTHWGGSRGATAAPASVRQGWLQALGEAARAEHGADWDAIELEEGSADFMGLLARLQTTRDFQQQPAALAERVFCMLQAARAHTELREALFEQARQVLTCQDSVALSFSNLELRMLVWQAQVEAGEGGEQAALLRLGRQLWRLEQVEAIALEDIQARGEQGRDVDPIEVMLAYRVGLREPLDLPAQPSDMTFAEVANVDARQLEQVRARVTALQTPERLAQSLVDREFWQHWLERAHAERLAALDEPYQERLASLLDEAQATSGGEGEALAQMNAVRDERQVARRALLLELTQQALREAPAD